jgi:hypothetical protein
MTPDLNPVINARLAEIRKWCRHPRHIAARKEQVRLHPLCSRCGRPASLILHEYPDDYRHGFVHYVELIERGERPTGCPACNKAERSGRRPCPSCVEKHKRDPEVPIHYITQDQDRCRYCESGFDPEAGKRRHERSNRTRNKINRCRYFRAHPMKKAIIDGEWVEVPR